MKVFIVEDAPQTRQELVELLAAVKGFEVVGQAGSVREALAGIEATAPQAITLRHFRLGFPVCEQPNSPTGQQTGAGQGSRMCLVVDRDRCQCNHNYMSTGQEGSESADDAAGTNASTQTASVMASRADRAGDHHRGSARLVRRPVAR